MLVTVVVSDPNAYFVVKNLTINEFVEVVTPIGGTARYPIGGSSNHEFAVSADNDAERTRSTVAGHLCG